MEMDKLSQEEQELLKKLEDVKRRMTELAKPLEVSVTNVVFGGFPLVEIKLSRFDQTVVDRLRLVPGRNYIIAREVSQFPISNYDRLVYELKEVNVDLIISEEFKTKIQEWKDAPHFKLSYLEKRHQIRIDKTIKQISLPYIYEMGSWTIHPDYYTFGLNELMKWMEMQLGFEKNNGWKFEMDETVTNLYKEQVEREKLLNEFADMKDAPDITFSFNWTGTDGTNHHYDLKSDQRVACKFDDTFNNRSLISFDMGKGKTAIAIAQSERHNERILFICKADLKTNIKREVFKFTGKEAHVFAGVEPDGLDVDLMLVNKQQYNILNYDVIGRETKDKNDKEKSLMKWVELINIANFDRICYDEAHYMKNMETLRSKGGRALKSPKVMLLTGTPIVNRPGELFPILNIIDPLTFYDYAAYLKQFTDYDGMPKNLPYLHKLLKRYMIRRLRSKDNDPNRIPQYHELTPLARKNYIMVLEGLYIALRNPNYQSEVHNILTQLLRLKQICADDKVDFTVDLCETALDETEAFPWNKVLIFSQFKATQAEICNRIGPRARIINGEVTDKARYDLIDKFQDPRSNLKVLVTNITEGITLTQAGTTIINDLWWTPKDHVQAEGRAFGRENDPHGGNSYYVLAEDSIDDMIWALLEKKMNIAKSIVDDVFVASDEQNTLFQDLINMLKRGG